MLQVILNWIIAGWIYALISIGFNLIYSSVRFYHLAYWALALLWSYSSYLLINSFQINFFVAMILSSFFIWFTWIAMWKICYKPLKKKWASDTSMLVASFWLLIILQNMLALIFWNTTKSVSITDNIKEAYQIFWLSITFNQLIIFTTTIVLIIIFEFILNKTPVWVAIRAVGQNKDLAKIIWINSDKVILYTFYIWTFLSVIWASLISLEKWIKPMDSLYIILKIIVACIIWWIWNIRWALAWWLILWIVENIWVYFLWWSWKDVVAFSLLTVFLLFKPLWLFWKSK